jgi:MFS family permease
MLIAARAVQGFGAAIMMALTLAFVGDAVPKERTGSAMGLLGTMSAIGTALGPSLGGLLIAGYGWRTIFFLNVPLGLLTLLLAWRHLPADRTSVGKADARFDIPGTALLALTLAAYALAMTVGHGRFSSLNFGLMLGALIGLVLFVLVESRSRSPLLRPEMFRNPVLSAGFAMSLLVTTVMMTTLVLGPFYLSGALGLEAARIGLVMSCGPLVAAVVGVPAGRVVDRYGAHRMSIAGLVGMAIGAIVLPALASRFGVAGYIAPLGVITAGYALFQAANNTSVMTNTPSDQRGVISGMLSLSRNLGLITGASAMGSVFAFGAGTADIVTAGAEAIRAGMQFTFSVATTLIVAAIVIASFSKGQSSFFSRPD